jgi:short-subunit dehydrogenase
MIKKILVTGTSSGLGFKIADSLSKKYKVVGLSRSIGKASKIKKKKF